MKFRHLQYSNTHKVSCGLAPYTLSSLVSVASRLMKLISGKGFRLQDCVMLEHIHSLVIETGHQHLCPSYHRLGYDFIRFSFGADYNRHFVVSLCFLITRGRLEI